MESLFTKKGKEVLWGKQLPRRALRLLETKMSPELVLRTTAQTGSIGGHCLLDAKTLESRNSRFKGYLWDLGNRPVGQNALILQV